MAYLIANSHSTSSHHGTQVWCFNTHARTHTHTHTHTERNLMVTISIDTDNRNELQCVSLDRSPLRCKCQLCAFNIRAALSPSSFAYIDQNMPSQQKSGLWTRNEGSTAHYNQLYTFRALSGFHTISVDYYKKSAGGSMISYPLPPPDDDGASLTHLAMYT